MIYIRFINHLSKGWVIIAVIRKMKIKQDLPNKELESPLLLKR